MKRIPCFLLTLLCCLLFATVTIVGVAESEQTLTIDTGKATVQEVITQDGQIKTEILLFKGHSCRLAYILDGVDTSKTPKVTWTSSDPAIATVSSGNVTGKSAGTVLITCSIKLADETVIEQSVQVTVDVAVYSLRAKEQTLKVNVGETTDTPEIIISPTDATCQTVTWAISDESIATVDANGRVTGIKAGKTKLIITSAENNAQPKSCTVPIVVSQTVQSIVLDATEAEIAKAKSITLKASVFPEDSTNKNVKWSSSDSTIATVSNGIVTGRAAGTVTITCSAADGHGAEATCTVEVFSPVNSISFVDKAPTIFVDGAPISLATAINPTDAKYTTLTWSSSDESIATVDQSGLVTPIKSGKTTITITANDKINANTQQKKATCIVTVNQAVKEISIDGGDQTLAKGKSLKLTANVGPDDATNKKITWSSSDTTIATVTGGTVVGKKTGVATITATATDGSDVSASIRVTIIQGVTAVKLDKNSLVLFPDDYGTIHASVQPTDATVQTVSWSSSDPSVATVNSQGMVRGVAKGTANIIATATDGSGKSASIKVYVEPAIPLTIESLGKGVYRSDLLGFTVKNHCQKSTIVNFDFTMTLTSIYGISTTSSYSIGKDETISPGVQKTIKRTVNGVGSADSITLTITGVELKDGTFYSIPEELQETWTFSF